MFSAGVEIDVFFFVGTALINTMSTKIKTIKKVLSFFINVPHLVSAGLP